MKITELAMDPDRTDYEIHNYHKLDKLLEGLCDLVDKGQHANGDFGLVGAGLLSLKYPYMARLNRPGDDGRIHAEHAVFIDFINKYGEIPKGTVLLTTLSPCNKPMDERDGPSCADLTDKYGIKKVYCGLIDPTQNKGENDRRQYNLMETQNPEIRKRCEEFAESFLGNIDESHALDLEHGSGKELKRSPDYRRSRQEHDAIKKADERVKKGYDWKEDDEEHDYQDATEAYDGPQMKFLRPGELSGSYTDQQLKDLGFKISSKGNWYTSMQNWLRLTTSGQVKENFADGRNPQDKGDSARLGIPKHASISTLRKIAHQGGRKGQLAHWQANMRSGRNK
jgi:pyrimidine deaminase RibD-like protein